MTPGLESDPTMRRLENAGRRFAAAERERLAALRELTAACADRPDLTTDELARITELPVTGLIAIRMRLEDAPPHG